MKASKQLKADKYWMVLPADKGKALEVLDRKEYIRKARDLLNDTNTYRTIQSDPTNKLKNKLIDILRKIKADTRMQENIYRRMYPTGASSPKFYWASKDTQERYPPEAHSFKYWLCHIWSGQRNSQDHKTIG